MERNNLCNFVRGHYGEHVYEAIMYLKFGPVVQEGMSFKDNSYLELWQPLCSMD